MQLATRIKGQNLASIAFSRTPSSSSSSSSTLLWTRELKDGTTGTYLHRTRRRIDTLSTMTTIKNELKRQEESSLSSFLRASCSYAFLERKQHQHDPSIVRSSVRYPIRELSTTTTTRTSSSPPPSSLSLEATVSTIAAMLASLGLVLAFPHHHRSTQNDAAALFETSSPSATTATTTTTTSYAATTTTTTTDTTATATTTAADPTTNHFPSVIPEPMEQPVADERCFFASKEKGKAYDISVCANKGRRLNMEDEFFVANDGRFVAVFDGHGGYGVSRYLKRNLYSVLLEKLRQKVWEENDDDEMPLRSNTLEAKQIPSIGSYVTALRESFYQVDREVLCQDVFRIQGSTAVAVVFYEKQQQRTILSANLGDSRAILSRNGRAVELTKDHKPNDPREKERIISMGERIEWDHFSRVHRVRTLSLSRAVGDYYAKPVVSGEVEIKHFPVADDQDEFVVLASDGLWDVMTSQDVVDFIHEQLQQQQPTTGSGIDTPLSERRRKMARIVAREAIKRGSADNVCVLIVWLDKKKSANNN